MIYDREYIEQFIDRFVRPTRPELVAPLLQAFDALKSGAVLSEKSHKTLLNAASDKSAHIYQVATEFLGEFAEKGGPALSGIRQMSESSLAHVRHNAILCLSENTPRNVSLEIICNGLIDKSSKVRTKAADWALRLNLQEAASYIAQAIQIEKNSNTSSVMRHVLERLKKCG